MYAVPDERLYPKYVEWTRMMYDKFTTNETDALVIAQLLGHSSIGGAFNMKIAAMGAYGLVDRRLGKIRVTDIGRKIVFGSGAEKVDGVKSALFKVELWNRLYQEYTAKGAELPSNFWADLARIADIPPDEAKSKAEWVVKAYNTDISYLRSVEKEMGQPGSGQTAQMMAPLTQTGQGIARQESRGRAEPGMERPPTEFESGRIYFVSPDDKIKHEAPRSAWQIDLLKTYIDGVLDHVKEQLVQESKYVAEKDKAKKPQDKQNQ
jgi:hypothetical protein